MKIKTKILENIKIHIKPTVVVFLIFIFVILAPFVIESIYNIVPPLKFFNISYSVEDILLYYGSASSFLGTVILGYLTLRQNKLAQKKSDEVSRLQLELQKKSMAMAESQYQYSKSEKNQQHLQHLPKFEVKINLYHGTYGNMMLSLKNVSSLIISSIFPISLIATESGKEITKATKLETNRSSLLSNETAIIGTNLPELLIPGNPIKYYSNLQLEFSFSCEDEQSNVHYFRAKALVPSTKDFYNEVWSVEKVG